MERLVGLGYRQTPVAHPTGYPDLPEPWIQAIDLVKSAGPQIEHPNTSGSPGNCKGITMAVRRQGTLAKVKKIGTAERSPRA